MFKEYLDDEEHKLVKFPRQADVYSFGVICSEILTGNVPYHGIPFRPAKELYKLLTDSDTPLRPELPILRAAQKYSFGIFDSRLLAHRPYEKAYIYRDLHGAEIPQTLTHDGRYYRLQLLFLN